MRAKAVALALTQKMKDGRILFVDSLPMLAPKTKDAKSAIAGLSKVKGFTELATRRNNAALVLLSAKSNAVVKSFSNMGNVLVEETRNANPVDLLKYRYILVVNPEASIKLLSARIESK